MIKDIRFKSYKKALFLIAVLMFSSGSLNAQTAEDINFTKALSYYNNKDYAKTLEVLNKLKSDEVFDIYIDYYKVLSNYHLWLKDTSSTPLLRKARASAETYMLKHDDKNIDFYENVANALNELKRREMKVVIISDTTFIPTNPKYDEALKYVTALEYYQNKDYLKAYETFKSVNRGRSMDSQTDYYELMSLYSMYKEKPGTKNWKTELQKKTSDFLTKYNAKTKYHDPDIHSKVSNINKSITPVSKRQPYLSLGYEGGLIAPYGIRFEYMSKAGLGLFANVRTSLAKDQDILNEKIIENKNEVMVGPVVRLVDPWLNLNLGVGAGYYSSLHRNDYKGVLDVGKTTYLATYAGLTLKLGKVGLSGGASFMDIGEALFKPEPTIGITYQIK